MESPVAQPTRHRPAALANGNPGARLFLAPTQWLQARHNAHKSSGILAEEIFEQRQPRFPPETAFETRGLAGHRHMGVPNQGARSLGG